MTRPGEYKARPPVTVLCACGCGETCIGRISRKYLNGTHRKRDWKRRRSKEKRAA